MAPNAVNKTRVANQRSSPTPNRAGNAICNEMAMAVDTHDMATASGERSSGGLSTARGSQRATTALSQAGEATL